MATTDALVPLMVKGIRKNYDIVGSIYELQGKKLFHVASSDSRYEQEQMYVPYGLPGVRLDGEIVPQSAMYQDFNRLYVHTNYGLADVIPNEAIDDDQYGMLVQWASGRGSSMAEAYITLQEIQAANYLSVVGFASGTSVLGSPDGVSIFNTAHPLSAQNPAVTYSNTPAVATDLSLASFNAARANLEQQPKANGQTLIKNVIKRLVVNPNLRDVATQICSNPNAYNTADRKININDGFAEMFVWPYWRKSGATSATAYNGWFVQGDEHFLRWYERDDVSFDSQKLVNINSTYFASFMRFSLGHSGARGLYGSAGT